MVLTYEVVETDCTAHLQESVSIHDTFVEVYDMRPVQSASLHMDIQFPLPLDVS
jgi:hypothetical protein